MQDSLYPLFDEVIHLIVGRVMPHGFDITDDHTKCNTEKKVQDYWREHVRIIVWSGESENTIFANPETNWAFRAWHDWVHVTHNLGHSTQDEVQVCGIQQDMLSHHLPEHINFEQYYTMLSLIRCEIVQQRKYYDKHGHYVPNQREFTKQYMGW